MVLHYRAWLIISQSHHIYQPMYFKNSFDYVEVVLVELDAWSLAEVVGGRLHGSMRTNFWFGVGGVCFGCVKVCPHQLDFLCCVTFYIESHIWIDWFESWLLFRNLIPYLPRIVHLYWIAPVLGLNNLYAFDPFSTLR